MGLMARTPPSCFRRREVPAANLLGGEEGHGLHQFMHDLPYERIVIAVGPLAPWRAPSKRH